MRVRMLDASGYRDYRYLIEDVDRHGNIRIYFRLKKGQPKIRLHALPGTEEFDKEYRRALTAKLRPPAEAASAGDNAGGGPRSRGHCAGCASNILLRHHSMGSRT